MLDETVCVVGLQSRGLLGGVTVVPLCWIEPEFKDQMPPLMAFVALFTARFARELRSDPMTVFKSPAISFAADASFGDESMADWEANPVKIGGFVTVGFSPSLQSPALGITTGLSLESHVGSVPLAFISPLSIV